MRWGITVPFTGVSLAEHETLVHELPDLGYTDAWSSEAFGADAFSPLALASTWAPQLRLGTAIVPVYTRGPGLLAMQAATMAEAAPGRFVLGIGTSSPVIVEQWNAASFTEPYNRVRDTARFLRAALAGHKVTEAYDTFEVRGFRLERPPEQPPPIMLAALRPGMLRLAAREGDGVITNWLAATDVSTIREVVGPDVELAARLFVCPTEDAEVARRIGRRLISSYMTVPVYRKFHEWLGRGEKLARMNELWSAGERKAAGAAIPDDVVDELVVHGSPERCRENVRQYVESGLTTPMLAVIPAGDDAREMASSVRALAPAV